MDDSYHLAKCLNMIQEQLPWGKANGWTNKDFEILSEKIYEKAGMLISYQTLRRLFGKVTTSSQYKPQLETKNALAIFVGYKDWDTFKQAHVPPPPAPPTAPVAEPEIQIPSVVATEKKIIVRKVLLAAFGVIVIISIMGYYLLQEKPTGPVSFKVEHVSGRVPLNVIFHYDVSKLNSDSIFLNFGTGIGKMLLPKNQKTVTMSYLVPGLYRAVLTADNKIIRAETIHAQSAGWSGIVYANNDYFFLQDKSMIKNGVMAYLPEDKGTPPPPSALYQPIKKNALVEFNNFKDFGIDGKNFVLETRLRVVVPDSGQYCYKALIKVKGEHYPVRAAFVSTGCNSDALLQFGEVLMEGKYNDLTFMGQSFTQWHTVRLEVKNKQGKLFLDDTLLNSTVFKKNIGNIKGLSFRLREFGAVDYVKLYDGNNQLVYQEEFDTDSSLADTKSIKIQ